MSDDNVMQDLLNQTEKLTHDVPLGIVESTWQLSQYIQGVTSGNATMTNDMKSGHEGITDIKGDIEASRDKMASQRNVLNTMSSGMSK